MAAEVSRDHSSGSTEQETQRPVQSDLPSPLAPAVWLERGKSVLAQEIEALSQLQANLGASFSSAVDCMLGCRGKIVTTGIGKAGIIAQKFSASLSSTGSPSHFLHPVEAVHGDLGCLTEQDVVVIFSYSGETEEIVRLLSLIAGGVHSVSIIAITGETESTLGRSSDFVVPLGKRKEACSHGLAPSTSTTLMLALSDALALVLSDAKAFTREQFGVYHPGGSLGKQLQRVTEIMRSPEQCRIASETLSIREVFVRISRPGRRSGAIMLTNAAGQLTGIFTDSDLARILEQQRDEQLDQPVQEVMTRSFHTITAEAFLPEAVDAMAQYKISELPVVGPDRKPIGMIDITDVVQESQGGTSSSGEVSFLQHPQDKPEGFGGLRVHGLDIFTDDRKKAS
ncbi:MAG: KpsF/GutQ family sugar-phosphate isomerase [Planctomycetota bacterium]